MAQYPLCTVVLYTHTHISYTKMRIKQTYNTHSKQ